MLFSTAAPFFRKSNTGLRHSSLLCCGLGLLVAVGIMATAQSADAQVSVGVGRGVSVRAPGVGVNVGGYGGVSVRTPSVGVAVPGRVYVGPRPYYAPPRPFVGRRFYRGGVVVSGGPVVSGGVVTSGPVVTSSTVVQSSATVRFEAYTEAQLAAMGAVELREATLQASAAFDAALSRVKNGEGWQTYLALPIELHAGEVVSVEAVEKLLKRFDSVARDSQYSMIAKLDGFAATRLALSVLVDREDVLTTAVSASATTTTSSAASSSVSVEVQGETLPRPAASTGTSVRVNGSGVDVRVNTGGEQSVLINTP